MIKFLNHQVSKRSYSKVTKYKIVLYSIIDQLLEAVPNLTISNFCEVIGKYKRETIDM
jgi:hypothetical protein